VLLKLNVGITVFMQKAGRKISTKQERYLICSLCIIKRGANDVHTKISALAFIVDLTLDLIDY
jgi:hypothetical protein